MVSRPVTEKTIAANGRTKVRKWSTCVSPATAARLADIKPIAQMTLKTNRRFRRLDKTRQITPATTPVMRAPITTVALLRSMSSGERRGSEARVAGMAEIEPAVGP